MFCANLPILTSRSRTVPTDPSPLFWPDRISAPPTDCFEVNYTAPYISPNGIYTGMWNKTEAGYYSNNDPLRLYWVFTDGETDFSVETGRFWGKNRVKSITTPNDVFLNGFQGEITCVVNNSKRWVMTLEYVCGATFYRRNIKLLLSCNTLTGRQHQAVAEQIRDLLNSEGYYDFDDVFR